MTRVYIFCEGKRDKRFLKRLLREKKDITAYQKELGQLYSLLKKRFEGIALFECGGYDKLLEIVAKMSRDLTNQPKVFQHAVIFVIGDGDKVNIKVFLKTLENEIRKLNPVDRRFLEVGEEGSDCVVLKSLKELDHNVRVFVLTVPVNLEKQLADNIRRLHYGEVKDSTDDEAIHIYCDMKYKCDEEEMMEKETEVVGPLLDSGWARRIVDLLE